MFLTFMKNYAPPKPAPTYTPVPIVNTTSILDDIKRKTKTSPTKKQKLDKEQKPKVVKGNRNLK